MGRTALWAAVLACASVAVGEEQQTVDKLVEKIGGVEPVYVPAGEKQLAARRAWLQYTVERFDGSRLLPLDDDETSDLRDRLEIDAIQAQLARRRPDAGRLREILTGFQQLDPALRNHSVASIQNALRAYVVLLEDADDSEAAAARVAESVAVLKRLLIEYQRVVSLPLNDSDPLNANSRKRRELLTEIHRQANRLRLRAQMPELTETLRQHYLHPKAQVWVSHRLLNAVTDFPIGPFPVNRQDGCTTVCGNVSTKGRIQIATVSNAAYAVLVPQFDDCVYFHGMAHRGRLSLGVTASFGVDLRKPFYVMQNLPDAGPTLSRTRFIGADTSRGRLVDRIATRSISRQFNGAEIDGQVEEAIDTAIHAAADLIHLPGFTGNFAADPAVPHERRYRTTESAAQFVLYTARDGFGPPTSPPQGVSDADFAVSIHESAVSELPAKIVWSNDNRGSLAMVWSLLSKAFDIDGAGSDGGIELWFPDREQFIFFHEGEVTINFLAQRHDATGEPFVGVLRAHPASIVVSAPDSSDLQQNEDAIKLQILSRDGVAEEQRRAFEEQLREQLSGLWRLNAIRLPMLADLPKSGQLSWEQKRRLRSIRIAAGGGFLTLSGSLAR